MITTLSDFISQSSAEPNGNGGWTVYCDGENKVGAINNCEGDSEYEAKEYGWIYFQKLKAEADKLK